MEVAKQVVLITGGAGYIGGAIADRFAADGASLAIFDINEEACRKKVLDLREKGVAAEYYVTDLCDYEAVQKQVQAVVACFGRIDVLVTCAGGSARSEIRPFLKQSMEVLHRIIDMNLYGALHVLHAVAPLMAEAHQGKIVNIGSLVGMQCVPGCLDYGAAKAGVISMTRSLAMELGSYGINVNCVSPGKVQRPKEQPADPKAFASRFQLLDHLLTGNDVAELVHFLASPAADGIIGQNYPICAGRSVGLRGDMLQR